MTWQIIRADARALPIEDATVDLIVTSPPYWGLRSYRDDGEHYDGQIGSESTPQQFVDELVGMIDSEWRRVLKPQGSMFLNMGDKYAGAGGGNDNTGLGVPRGEQSADADARGNPRRYRQGTGMARPQVSSWSALADRPQPHRPGLDTTCGDHLVETERTAGVGDGQGATVA